MWANPIPVSVVLVQVTEGDRTGLLVVRRAIPPGVGKLALVGGFVEETETWQAGGAREVREETGAIIDAATLVPLWFTSTEPRPNRVLLFSVAPPLRVAALPPFIPADHDNEASERGVIFRAGWPGRRVRIQPLHTEAARSLSAHLLAQRLPCRRPARRFRDALTRSRALQQIVALGTIGAQRPRARAADNPAVTVGYVRDCWRSGATGTICLEAW